ncbi:major facilitator superfamily domain-containing protein [Hygrophoropsis aurantiaca]|uniref:Major facilitator superfamily domain-containing protein n=1 Tax=Hygrophoropsis aurantiaca TaxID=72124 RepID=A0ACB8AMD2_9AGAM|nr:major facilitator superfamily domain-containing protein [Hygrophoropsis aurantiaca]
MASLQGALGNSDSDARQDNDINKPHTESNGLKAAQRTQLERRLLLKLDMRMSILVVIYILNYIDRSNTTAARLQGFEQDLHLEGQDYSTVLSILYVGYIIMQIPSNLFLNWVGRPSIYLPSCMIVWGVISTLTGGFIGALLARFFIGFVEASFYPGALFLISRWYKRDEVGIRTTILCCGSLLSSAWGSLIASGILDGMQGKLGHGAWRWLFYIEGSLTIFVAICSIFILPDFPHNTRWLTPEERQLAISRLEDDMKVNHDTYQSLDVSAGQGLWMAITDGKVWWFAAIATLQILAQSLGIFFPTLSATMGFDTTISLVLCAPPWIFTTLVAFIVSRQSDKDRRRFIYIAATDLAGIVGFIIAMCTMNITARYVSLFLMAQMYAGLIVFYAWMSNSFLLPPAKRAAAIALINAFSQLGNVIGAYVWPTSWGPTYRYSMAICLACTVLVIGMCWIMSRHLAALNRRSEENENSGSGEEDITQGFRYLVAARLQGFEQDLHLEGQQYSTVLSILFLGYILMQIPSNLFLNWLGRPSIYLPSCMIVWGVLSILTAHFRLTAITSFTGALLIRFFIGFVEAAFFPGVLFLISRWYKRDELGLRSAIVTCGSLMSNGWGALIASGILEGMQGKLGHAAWSFFMTQMFAGLIVFYAWMSNSFPQPPAKRAASLALINGLSQLGNVVGSYVWPSSWGSTYRYSFAICVVTAGIFIGMCWVMHLHLVSLNRQMEMEEEAAQKNGKAITRRHRFLV